VKSEAAHFHKATVNFPRSFLLEKLRNDWNEEKEDADDEDGHEDHPSSLLSPPHLSSKVLGRLTINVARVLQLQTKHSTSPTKHKHVHKMGNGSCFWKSSS